MPGSTADFLPLPGDVIPASTRQRTYDRLSPFYDSLSASERRLGRLAVKRLELHPGERLLEIGCASARLLAECARSDASLRLTGADLSPGMLRQALRRLQTLPDARRPALVRLDALHLPFAPASFDAVLLAFTLELFTPAEIPAVLAGCRRLLRTGGRLGLAALHLPARPNRITRLYLRLHAAFPALVDCCPLDAAPVLAAAGFRLESRELYSLWGLLAAVITASPLSGTPPGAGHPATSR
jgi:demethylmenaquinone methyltransferase/2-methoxy-6-polyprenyl-1,4-benzoquinol methylase